MSQKVAIGIDLGTTYSCVGVMQNGKVEIIANDQGNRTTPSYVAFTDTEKLTGDAAKSQAALNSRNTVFDAKRLIGRQFTDSSTQSDIKHFPFKVSADPQTGKCIIHAEYKNEEKTYTPEQISAFVLMEMKKTAEAYLGHEVHDAVVTVPAYFNQNQRVATKKAAENAELNVLRIINEPTAAALAYGYESKLNELVLVYDLGGGTFDVTLLQLSEDNVYQVLSTSGDTKLGGDDFDNIIVDCFKKTIPSNFKPFKDFDVRLKKFSEEVKVQLNYKKNLKRQMKYCGTIDNKIYHHTFEISSSQYSDLIKSLLTKTKSHVLNALNDANKKISQLDKIILVGGSTKSNYVREYVKDNFNTKVYHEIDPDLTVAAGAANLAQALQEKSSNSSVLIDVTPLSLGIETKGGLLHKIIPRNANIPVTSSEEFITS
jgi:L1 cell adhesion molecule like protein